LDIATIIGMLLALGLMLQAMSSGSSLLIFVNAPSVLIVMGGTLGATLIHYPLKELLGAFAILKKAFLHKDVPISDSIAQLLTFATKARKEGILSLESMMDDLDDLFLLKGLQMAVDGQEPASLKEMLYLEIEYIRERHEKGGDIFKTMAFYAPAMGMIGTLIGLVQMLQTMDDPSSIGPAMAVALLTTFYGAVMANVLLLPIAGKLKRRSETEVLSKTLITEGMESILAGENPRIMEQKLHTFIAPRLRESFLDKQRRK